MTPELEAHARRLRRVVADAVLGMLEDPADADRVRDLAVRATGGDESAWAGLAVLPERVRDRLAEAVVADLDVQPFPTAEPNPLTGYGERVRAFVEDVVGEPVRGEGARELAALTRREQLGHDELRRLNAPFARSPEDLAMLVPDLDEQVVADTTVLTTGTTTATTLTATTFTTVACTTTTTTTTTTTYTTTTTASHWCS